MGQIRITGSAKEIVNADEVRYNIEFSNEEENYCKAISRTQEDVEKFLEEVEKLGIKTSMVHLDDDSIEQGIYDKEDYYRANRTLTFRCKMDVRLNNAILDIIANNDIIAKIDTSYYFSKEKEKSEELLRKALLNSKKKAELLAKTNNQRVVGIAKIEDSNSRYFEYNMLCDLQCYCGDTKRRSDDLASKEIELSETIDVTWDIEWEYR